MSDDLADRVARLQARRAASMRGRPSAPSTLVAEPPVSLPMPPGAPPSTVGAPDSTNGHAPSASTADTNAPATGGAPRTRRLPRVDLKVLGAVVVALALIAASLAFAAANFGGSDGPAPADPRGMVVVPAGRYVLGARAPTATDAPAAVVELESYAIDRKEVTNAQYKRFVTATDTDAPASWPDATMPAERATYPVVGLPRDDAAAYCDWNGKRLPSEAEWEAAGRGPAANPYPWGTEHGAVDVPQGLHAVGTVAGDASPFGARDMYGNAQEWVSEPYSPLASGNAVLRGRGGKAVKTLSDRVMLDGNESSADPALSRAGVRCAADSVQSTVVDDFSSPASGWPRRSDANVGTAYTDAGAFAVDVTARQTTGRVLAGLDAADVAVGATVVRASERPSDALWGVVARASSAGAYGCLVDPLRAEWLLVRYDGTTRRVLARGNPLALGAPSGAADQVSVEARGDRISCFINGQHVAIANDGTYARGDAGLVVHTQESEVLTVEFDDFTARLGAVDA